MNCLTLTARSSVSTCALLSQAASFFAFAMRFFAYCFFYYFFYGKSNTPQRTQA